MRITCPCCYGQFELEAALNVDAARSALVTALRMPAPLATLIGNYLGCFRSRSRALTPDRAERLLVELLPMLEGEYVVREGLRRDCPVSLWQQALEEMQEARSQGKLTLPLKSHGYLLQIAAGLAEKAGAKVEREREVQKQRTARSTEGDRKFAILERLSRITGDLELGLIDAAEAERRRAEVRQA